MMRLALLLFAAAIALCLLFPEPAVSCAVGLLILGLLCLVFGGIVCWYIRPIPRGTDLLDSNQFPPPEKFRDCRHNELTDAE